MVLVMESYSYLFAEIKAHYRCKSTRGSDREEASLLRPPNIWNNENKFVFNKRTIKVCISCSWRNEDVLGPQRLAHHT